WHHGRHSADSANGSPIAAFLLLGDPLGRLHVDTARHRQVDGSPPGVKEQTSRMVLQPFVLELRQVVRQYFDREELEQRVNRARIPPWLRRWQQVAHTAVGITRDPENACAGRQLLRRLTPAEKVRYRGLTGWRFGCEPSD